MQTQSIQIYTVETLSAKLQQLTASQLVELSKLAGVSISLIYKIRAKSVSNVTVETAHKLTTALQQNKKIKLNKNYVTSLYRCQDDLLINKDKMQDVDNLWITCG